MKIASSQKGPADLINRLHAALHVIAQANCSMGAVAREVKPTEHALGVLCPDLVMPMLIDATTASLGECFEVLDQLEAMGSNEQRREAA